MSAIITIFRCLTDTAGTELPCNWDTLAAAWSTSKQYLGDATHPGWSPAQFNGQRSKANVSTLYALVLDVDKPPKGGIYAALAPWSGILALWYTTKSATEDAPRMRIVLPLSRDVTPDEHARLWLWAEKRMSAHGTEIDGACKDASRFWYWPTLPVNGFYRSGMCDGDLLDVDAALAYVGANDAQVPGFGLPTCPSDVAPLDHARHIAAELAPAAVEGQGGHTTLLRTASALVIGLGIDAIEAKVILWDLYNPRCKPPWGDGERAAFERKVDEAAKNERQLTPGWLLQCAASPALAADEKRTDLGNARRLVRMYGQDLRYFTAARSWLVWDGARWKTDDTRAVERFAKAAAESLWKDLRFDTFGEENDGSKSKVAWALKSQSRVALESAVRLASSEPGIPVTADMLDADPWLLNVQNGVLDLRTGALRPPERALLMTKVCAAAYDPDARSDLWDRFIADITGVDVELSAYIQRALGYALFGAWREKAFWFGFGPPDGGKSTLLGIIGDILGDYHTSAAASTWMHQYNTGGNRGDVTRLRGARLVTTLEVRADARFDEELVKKVTGGDSITAAAKYQDDIEFAPTFALWFGANHRPVISDDDDGFWSRVRCVPFEHAVPANCQDKALREKLASPEHAPAVLSWLVAGFQAWQREGMGTCGAVVAATSDYKRTMNQAWSFAEEMLVLTGNPDDHVFTSELRARYDAWCRDNMVRRPLSSKDLAKRLRALGAAGGGGADDSRVNGQRVWRGLRFSSDSAGRPTLLRSV
jgi:putative DNA primase/helicase